MSAHITADWPPGKTRYRFSRLITALTLIAFVAGASITAIILQRVEAADTAMVAARVDVHFDELLGSLGNQLEHHALVLRGLAGLFAGSEQVSREEFGDYVDTIRLSESLPGVRSVGYAAAVSDAELLYVEPEAPDNVRTLGFNLLSDPVRKTALETASRSEAASMTAPVQLLSAGEGDSVLGLELYLTDYCSAGEIGPAIAPGLQVCGWVTMSIDINRTVGFGRDARRSYPFSEFALEITDNDAPAAAQNVYSSADFADTSATQYQRRAELPFAGRTWTVTARPLADSLVSDRNRNTSWILAAGSTITLLTTLFFLLLGRSYRRLLAVIDTSQDTLRQLEASQAQLQASEHSHREMFAANPLPMWVYDRETLRFLAVNAAAIDKYGYSREEFLALTIADIRPPEERARLLEYLEATPSAMDHAGYWKHTRKDGQIIVVEVHTHPITFNGKAAELVLARDVTERLQAERDLLARNAELERMNRAMVDRELRMMTLKAEINSLSKALGRAEPYRALQTPDGNGELNP